MLCVLLLAVLFCLLPLLKLQPNRTLFPSSAPAAMVPILVDTSILYRLSCTADKATAVGNVLMERYAKANDTFSNMSLVQYLSSIKWPCSVLSAKAVKELQKMHRLPLSLKYQLGYISYCGCNRDSIHSLVWRRNFRNHKSYNEDILVVLRL